MHPFQILSMNLQQKHHIKAIKFALIILKYVVKTFFMFLKVQSCYANMHDTISQVKSESGFKQVHI